MGETLLPNSDVLHYRILSKIGSLLPRIGVKVVAQTVSLRLGLRDQF